MEEKINITEILKEKPQGTKLHDLLYNVDVELDTISTTDTETVVWCTNETDNNTTCHRGYSEFGTVRGCPDGLQILLPSKEMRDWSKFAWKKGDILLSKDNGVYIIFEKFEDDAYTKFKGKHYFWKKLDEEDYSKEESQMLTSLFKKVNDNEAQSYINTIEERLGGKLNRETLEIEKQPEFKDGDILSCDEDTYTKHTTLIFHKDGDITESIVSLVRHSELVEDNEPIDDFFLTRLYYAREYEKKELFDALAKKGKTWDAVKKQIVDLKPKWTPKPFDRVITRTPETPWTANFFSHIDSDGIKNCIDDRYIMCLPYNDETAKLIGTTNNWRG